MERPKYDLEWLGVLGMWGFIWRFRAGGFWGSGSGLEGLLAYRVVVVGFRV